MLKKLLAEQLVIAEKAAAVLQDSYIKVSKILAQDNLVFSDQDKESSEALTGRFSRLSDFLVQKIFRTVDEAELIFDGTIIDRLNRMEKRQVISSSEKWKALRLLRNDIAHEYLMDEAKVTLIEAHKNSPILIDAVQNLKSYITKHNLI